MLAKAVSDSGNFFIGPMGQLVGSFGASAMSVLIITSAFACGMAFHNTAARYMYSLAREGVLPKKLAHTHPKFKSPHIASSVQSVLAALWLCLFAYFMGTDDPNAQAYLGVYTMLAVLGTMLELGEQSLALHRQVAERALALGLDGLVIVDGGPEGQVMAAAAQGLPRLALVTSPEEAAQELVAWLEPGDQVLLKASRGVALERAIPLLERALG